MTDTSVVVEDVSKRFRLYTERRNSLKERLLRGGSRYEEFWALRDVSLQVPAGSTFGLIGHNGSGKSTLLKLMAGIHAPTSGFVRTAGRVNALLELGAGFHPELSGRDNILLNGSILGMSRRQILDALDEIVEFSGLGSFIDAPVKVYSSGMYVRLGFAIAVNLDPEILIIDEVIAVGDEEFQRRCFDHLYALRRRGVTIVFVSHSMSIVQTLCDQVAWLDHGRLRQVGGALEVADAYLADVNARERLATAGGGGQTAEQHDSGSELALTRLDFYGADGAESIVATSGQPLRVRMHYEVTVPVEAPVFRLGVHTEGGVWVASPHSRVEGVAAVLPPGPGHVDYVVDRLILKPGSYVVSATVLDRTMAHVFDDRDRVFALHVRSGPGMEEGGLVDLGGRWESAPVAGAEPAAPPAATGGER